MLEEAIKRIQETFTKTEVIEEDGIKYLIRPSGSERQMMSPIQPATLKINTLSGVVEYLKDTPELYVHIESHNKVHLISGLSEYYRTREHHLTAAVNPSTINLNHYLPLADFFIEIMGGFEQDENTANILKFLGSVKTEDELRTDDDGIKQKVTVKSGITTLEVAEVPNPVPLRQFVTFPEIYQPEQKFVFRMRKDGQSVSCGLFKTDSFNWQMQCIQSIREFLVNEIPGVKIIS